MTTRKRLNSLDLSFSTPLDVMMMKSFFSHFTGYYKSVLDCVTSIAKKEGIRAFYLSLTTTLMMNVPYGCVMVSANESAKKFLNPSGEFRFSSSMLAGTCASDIRFSSVVAYTELFFLYMCVLIFIIFSRREFNRPICCLTTHLSTFFWLNAISVSHLSIQYYTNHNILRINFFYEFVLKFYHSVS